MSGGKYHADARQRMVSVLSEIISIISDSDEEHRRSHGRLYTKSSVYDLYEPICVIPVYALSLFAAREGGDKRRGR